MIQQINSKQLHFPDPHEANEDGIVAWGGDLHPYRLIKAYQMGIFPWYSKKEPILWWSPDPRLILELDDYKLRKSLKKNIKKYSYKINRNFDAVINECSNKKRKGQKEGSWIINDVIEAYNILHDIGIAHSIESYNKDGKLVGGLYGLSIGKVFCGESMFAHENDASKAAFTILIEHLKSWGYDFIDCQIPTQHLKSLGAIEVNREYFLERLYSVNTIKLEHKWELKKELVDKYY